MRCSRAATERVRAIRPGPWLTEGCPAICSIRQLRTKATARPGRCTHPPPVGHLPAYPPANPDACGSLGLTVRGEVACAAVRRATCPSEDGPGPPVIMRPRCAA